MTIKIKDNSFKNLKTNECENLSNVFFTVKLNDKDILITGGILDGSEFIDKMKANEVRRVLCFKTPTKFVNQSY